MVNSHFSICPKYILSMICWRALAPVSRYATKVNRHWAKKCSNAPHSTLLVAIKLCPSPIPPSSSIAAARTTTVKTAQIWRICMVYTCCFWVRLAGAVITSSYQSNGHQSQHRHSNHDHNMAKKAKPRFFGWQKAFVRA